MEEALRAGCEVGSRWELVNLTGDVWKCSAKLPTVSHTDFSELQEMGLVLGVRQ